MTCGFWTLQGEHKKTRFDRGLNSGPSACKADVITTTPPNPYTSNISRLLLLPLYYIVQMIHATRA